MDLRESAIKTYRYLRLAMIVLIVMLGAAVVIERLTTSKDCFESSISSYYYTPAQGVFVGVLVAVGVCMIALKGNTDWEDVLLNIGGALAPVVAFVPTSDRSTCSSVPVAARDTVADVTNNIPALLIAGGLGLALVLGITVQARMRDREPWRVERIAGVGAAAFLLAGASAWYLTDEDGFIERGHYYAAIPLFACILAVVVLNARRSSTREGRAPTRRDIVTNRYAAVAWAMVLVVVVFGGAAAGGWDHAIIWIEGLLIALFAVFWAVQTAELWTRGTDAA